MKLVKATRKLSQTQVEEQKIDADKQEIVLALKLRKQEELQKLALEAEEEANKIESGGAAQ